MLTQVTVLYVGAAPTLHGPFSACMVYELWKGQEQCNNAVPKLRRSIRTESHQQHTAIIHSATGSSGHHTLKASYKRRKRESSTTCSLYISHSPVCTHAHTHTHTHTHTHSLLARCVYMRVGWKMEKWATTVCEWW